MAAPTRRESPSPARSRRTSRASSSPRRASPATSSRSSRKSRASPTGCARSASSPSRSSSASPSPPGAWTSPTSTSRARPLLTRPRPAATTAGTTSRTSMKDTYEKLGIPQAEREHLAGVVGVWRQEPFYEGLKQEYADKGILFCAMDTAVTEHEDLVREHFMNKCVPPQDNKFSALHGAVWSGGSFLYVPKDVKVDLPLQAYFRMEGARRGHLRAHADHRRRGLRRELHRGLHRPDLLGQLDALRGRRDLRQGGRQGPLHDGAELVQGRVQPEHQAGDRGRARHGRVGRRLDGRQEGHALPGLVPDGRGRPRRPPQRGRGLRRRLEGHRRQGAPPGARTPPPTSSPSRSPRTAGSWATAAWSAWATTRRAPRPTSSATG